MNTVADNPCLAAWLHWLHTSAVPRRRSAATIAVYRHHLSAFATWMVTDLGVPFTPTTVTAYRMESYLIDLEQRHQRKPATRAQCRAAFTNFGIWLVETQQVSVNPARLLAIPQEEVGPPKALHPTVIRRLLDAAHHTGNPRDALIVELLAYSGMRASEVAGIQLDQIERGARTTWIRVKGKHGKSRRIPLPKHIGPLIESYVATRTLQEEQRPERGALLVGSRGAITRRTINRTVSIVAAHAALAPEQRAGVTPHAFRHTVATQLVRQRDLVTAADLLGHANINTTRQYAKASMEELEEAVEALYR